MLEKQTISINMGLGLDTATNDQSGKPNEFEELIDFVWNKEKQIEKRLGTTLLPQTVSTNFSNPQTIGTTSIFNGISSLGNQLLLQNKGAFYSYNDNADTWVQKGWFAPAEVSTTVVASGSRTNYAANSRRFANFTIHAYYVDNTQEIRYTFIENSTGNVIVDDALIEQGFNVQFFTTSVGSYIAYCGEGAYGIKVRSINTTTGALGSAVTVYSTPCNNFQVQVLPNSARGERIVFLAVRQSSLPGDTVDLFALDNTLTLDSTLGTANLTAPRFKTGSCLYFDSAINTNRIFIAYSFLNQGGIRPTWQINYAVAVYDIGASSWIAVLAVTPVRTSLSHYFLEAFDRENLLYNITAFTIPGTTNVRFLMQDFAEKYAQKVGRIEYNTIFDCIVTGSGTVLQNAEPRYFGYTLLSKAVAYPEANTVFVALGVPMPTQNCEVVVDLYRATQSAPNLHVLAKVAYQKTIGRRGQKSLADLQLSGGSLFYPSANETRNAARDSSGILRTDIDLFLTSVTYHQIDLQKQRGQNKVRASDSLFLSGGYLAEFDGAEITENNFHVAPDFLDVNYTFTGPPRRITIDTFGGTEALYCGLHGSYFENAPSFFSFTISSTTYRVYIYDELSGYVPPTGSWTNINVPISLAMNKDEILARVQTAIYDNTVLNPSAYNVFNEGQSTSPYIVPPAITNKTAITASIGGSGAVPAASLRYAAIYTYTDFNGKTHRSAPVFTPPITPASTGTVSLLLYLNQLTAKNPKSVKVEFYRTKANGTTFYKIGSLNQDKSWFDARLGRVWFIDRFSDSAIAFNEVLYTDGNIQENIGLGSVVALTNYKARVYAVTKDNPTAVYYSKTITDGSPVEFTPFNFITINSTNAPITAIAFLDDTLVVFKEEEIYLVAGDGANEIGTNSSYSLPSALATDVGCIDPNTVELIPQGLTFFSKMGLHLLNRGRAVEYIGYPVEDYNSKNICRVIAQKDNKESRELRVMMSDDSRALVYDYLMQKWGTFSQYSGQDATIWRGQFVRVNGSGQVFVETANQYTDVGSPVPSYNPILETEWLNLKDQQDYARIYRLIILGELFTACNLLYKIYYDYDMTNFDSYTFSSANITGSLPGDTVYQPMIHLKRQKCEAIKIRLEVDATGTNSERTLKLTDMAFQVGLKKGLNKVNTAKRL